MKKAVIIIMIFSLTGCGKIENEKNNNESNIKITNNEVNLIIKDNTLTNDEAIFILVNNSPESIFYGDDFQLERKINNKWYTLEMIEKVNFYLQPHQLNQDEFVDFGVNWTQFYGKLESGLYRLVKSYTYYNSKDKLYIAKEFLID